MAITPDDVRAVNGSTLDDVVIQPFIDAANCLTEQIEFCMASKNITEACIDQAGAFLAAHLLGSSGVGSETNPVKSEKFESYSVERIVGGIQGKGVLGTTYGQTANMLTGGCLQELDKAPSLVCYFG